jgi:hypothetical protein
MMPAWRDAVITWPVIHLAFEYLSMGGYSEKLPFLLEPVTSCMLSLIEELKMGGDYGLQQKYEKAKANLLCKMKNYKLDAP